MKHNSTCLSKRKIFRSITSRQPKTSFFVNVLRRWSQKSLLRFLWRWHICYQNVSIGKIFRFFLPVFQMYWLKMLTSRKICWKCNVFTWLYEQKALYLEFGWLEKETERKETKLRIKCIYENETTLLSSHLMCCSFWPMLKLKYISLLLFSSRLSDWNSMSPVISTLKCTCGDGWQNMTGHGGFLFWSFTILKTFSSLFASVLLFA